MVSPSARLPAAMLPMIRPWASKGGGCKCFYRGKLLAGCLFFFGGILNGGIDEFQESFFVGFSGLTDDVPFFICEVDDDAGRGFGFSVH